MHKSDIDKLEDILTNFKKYEQQLQLRKFELEYKEDEPVGKVVNEDAQDQRTIKSGGTTSVVENTVIKLHDDLKYRTLYSIVMNTPKFIQTLNEYERIIYEYRYKQKDLSVYEWDDIAIQISCVASKDNRSFSKSTTLRLRNQMLERLAKQINHVMM